MKKIIQYISTVVFSLLAIAACQDNENWKIITEVQPGSYVAGTATVYSAVAPAAAFTVAPIDGDAEKFPGMLSKYTWLKAGGEFTVEKADAEGNVTHYGKGNVVSGETVALVADGPAFTVLESGLYFLILNNIQNQLTIVPCKWGAIGSATPGGWDSETVFSKTDFNESTLKVDFTGTLVMSAAEMKFRYNQTWGLPVPYDALSNVTIHTNMGGIEKDVALTGTSTELKSGGENLTVKTAANYTITLTFDLRSSTFTAGAVMGDIIEPTYPEKLYMVGDAVKGWPGTWLDVATELIPVNGKEGCFWAVAYLNAGGENASGFKFSPVLDWKGDFGIAEDNTNAIGTYNKGSKNINVVTPGYYQIYVDMVSEKIIVTEPQVILKGDAAAGGWDSSMETDAFIVDNANKVLISNPFANEGDLRICVILPNIDWWRSEFIVLNGKIAFRGNGGDQDRVKVQAGQTVTLNFETGTGKIE
jgi:hypothetical protein